MAASLGGVPPIFKFTAALKVMVIVMVIIQSFKRVAILCLTKPGMVFVLATQIQ